jgi:hypothetical protein
VDEFTRGALAAVEEIDAQIVAFKANIESDPQGPVEGLHEILDTIAVEIRSGNALGR